METKKNKDFLERIGSSAPQLVSNARGVRMDVEAWFCVGGKSVTKIQYSERDMNGLLNQSHRL